MILERVRAESWGPLRWPVELALHPRVNLIHAPNESGKTTLVAAIRHGLLEPASANVDASRPWGSTLSPRVVVDFRTATARWRVEKAFGRHPAARLSRERRGVWEPVADDPDTVHAQTVALVTGAEVAGRHRGRESAEARRARRGVLLVLWREQGHAPLEDLELPGSAERDLAEAVGAAIVSDRDRRLIEAAEKRLAELLTPKRREETGDLARAAQEVEDARDALGERRQQARALREWEERAEAAAVELAETEERAGEARVALAGLRSTLAAAHEQVKELARAEERLQAVAGAWAEAKKRCDGLALGRAALTAARGEAERKAAVLQAQQEKAAGVASELDGAEGQSDAIEAAAREAAAAAEVSRARLELARALASRDGIAGRLDRAAPLEAELAAARDLRRAISVPDADGLSGLRALQQSMEVEAAKLDAGRLRVSFRAEAPLRAEVDVDGTSAEAAEIAAGGQARWDALERAEVRMAGVGAFHVERTLETPLARQRKKVGELRGRLQEELAGWGAASVAVLEERAAVAGGHEETIRHVEATLAGLLPEGREAAEGALAQAVARIAAIRERHAALGEETPDAGAAEAVEAAAEEAGREFARRDKERQDHAARVTALRRRLQEAEADLPALQGAVRESELQVSGLLSRIATLEEDGLTDEERLAQLAGLEADRQAALATVERLRAGASAAAQAEADFVAAEREVQSLERASQQLRTDVTAARARAAAITEKGSYSELARAEEALAAAEAAYAALRLRADARALLVDVLAAERDSQRAELFDPVGERAGRLLERVTGGRYATVRVEGGLRPSGVIPGDYPEETPPPDLLSGGAQEQLGTVIRLALAEVLAAADPSEGQTLILDEPLPQSDSLRRRRTLEVLSEPEPGLQIIVLAHDARDYAALRRDEEHDLLRLIEASREAAATE